jgi:transcriptional regulator with XRE-family HTH domain
MTTESLTRARLKCLYWNDRKTLTEIAEMFGVTSSRIWAMMEEWGIKRRGTGPTGRSPVGLERKDIIFIKRLLRVGGLTGGQIAERYDVSRQTINNILHGRTWRSVTDRDLQLADEEVVRIKKMLRAGKRTQVEIAEVFAVSPKTISDISTGKTREGVGGAV